MRFSKLQRALSASELLFSSRLSMVTITFVWTRFTYDNIRLYEISTTLRCALERISSCTTFLL